MKNEKKAVSREVAISEFAKFLRKYKAKELRRGIIKESEIGEDYIDAIEAIEDGLLVFDDKNHPKYTLREPLGGADSELGAKEIVFRSRIRPSERANVMSGLDVAKDQGKFTLRYLAFITGLAVLELDKLNSDDYDVINQVSSVF